MAVVSALGSRIRLDIVIELLPHCQCNTNIPGKVLHYFYCCCCLLSLFHHGSAVVMLMGLLLAPESSRIGFGISAGSGRAGEPRTKS